MKTFHKSVPVKKNCNVLTKTHAFLLVYTVSTNSDKFPDIFGGSD